MISRIRGELLLRDLERVEVMTASGVAYEIHIPTTVFERLPRVGEPVTLRTYHLVREDAQMLFGFLDEVERTIFTRLISASGVGPRLALALLSAMSAEMLVRSIRDRNVAALTAVSGVGKKTAERISVELSNKLDDLAFAPSPLAARTPGVEEALRALVALGITQGDADRAVRAVVTEQGSGLTAPELIRHALARATSK
ncbi:Holliday junction branch migration protein RuvA [Longimicrobium sp.]|uniref:Holliday junction branch migration protein RuvA n=1 Tax=Longimicrobium sp. TaxID=2029185 RepID=UPI002C1E83AB|nr:Holliday junction branch migration protein RuvA [Longimicrobium sp.]HSU14433.1 Holliday junction branch migration protein RuvA [Longimicrobium sp.]